MTSRKLAPMLLLALLISLSSVVGAADSPWGAWQFLIGEWQGTGGGSPGQGTGGFTLAPDLGGKVLVRRSHAEYPAANGRLAVSHDDLMIVHTPVADGTARAIYFDNEGHVITYDAKPAADGRSIALVSVEPAQPRFRLTYTKRDDGQVGIKFEIAPSGKVEELKPYLEGTVKRVAAASSSAPGRE
jgi:hypothetical protein